MATALVVGVEHPSVEHFIATGNPILMLNNKCLISFIFRAGEFANETAQKNRMKTDEIGNETEKKKFQI